ncbi:hypothetical protein VNO78_02604 [Psophocarpus tetragonolobus]|uniref:Uncharacterized protein n=1 Tax=Psophocarpus tetragonolobus TaxID=3891 RepID=A0AAN9T2S4_PSOTE
MPSEKEEQKLKGVAYRVAPNCSEFLAEDEGDGLDFGFQKAKMGRREVGAQGLQKQKEKSSQAKLSGYGVDVGVNRGRRQKVGKELTRVEFGKKKGGVDRGTGSKAQYFSNDGLGSYGSGYINSSRLFPEERNRLNQMGNVSSGMEEGHGEKDKEGLDCIKDGIWE